jgi:hypothetical protein
MGAHVSDSLALSTEESWDASLAPQEYEEALSGADVSVLLQANDDRPLPYQSQRRTEVDLRMRGISIPTPRAFLPKPEAKAVSGKFCGLTPGGLFRRTYGPRIRELVLAGLPPIWLYKHKSRKRIEQLIKATPPWVDREEMWRLQMRKHQATKSTGVFHNLDHIIPLCHPMVCGLNVPWNIQIITAAANAAKSNKWSPDQLELLPC